MNHVFAGLFGGEKQARALPWPQAMTHWSLSFAQLSISTGLFRPQDQDSGGRA